MKNIAIFASGSGTNAENIIRYFSNRTSARVCLVLSNRREAYVHKRAASFNVPSVFFDRNDFYENGKVLKLLKAYDVDFVVLADVLFSHLVFLIKSLKHRNGGVSFFITYS